MLDHWAINLGRKPLHYVARGLKKCGYKPDQITFVGFCIGLGTLPALYMQMYWLALICIVVNRIGDVLDGTLARMTTVSDAGGFLDIVLDFVFYSSVVLGFAMVDPESNGLAASVLLFTFIGTSSSFLGFAIMAERQGLESSNYPQKGFYYLGGFAEGTETFIFFVLFCLLPGYFSLLAYSFAVICLMTMVTRIIGGYLTLRRKS